MFPSYIIFIIIAFNMHSQQQRKSLLDPYRTIGGFISGKLSLSQSSPIALTAPTGCSFKVYSENLAIKVASPSFPHPITAAVSYNQYTYLRTEGLVVKMKYHHIVNQWEVKGGISRCDLLKFQGIIMLNEGSKLILIDEKSNEVLTQDFSFNIRGIVHPVTYVNKILLYSDEDLVLVNAISSKVLYSFQKFLKNSQQNNQKIAVIQASPLVDIVAVGFDSGVISFLHLRKDQAVFSIKQKLSVTALAFSHEQSWMTSGDEQGNVILWDLQNKKILYKFEQCLKGTIDSLAFLPGLPVVTCASSQANCIRQLRINLQDNKILSLYRQRLGSKEALESAVIASNNELVLSTKNDTMFVSFHSQCNSYLLPRTLDSKLPYHLVAKHFNVELYKGNSLEKTFPIHEYAIIAKIALSNKYYLVATKRRLVKLGGSSPVQWPIPNIKQILTFNQHSIYVATPNQIVVCDFNTNIILSRIEVNANALATNHSNTLISFENVQTKQIEVWDMFKISQGRIFPCETFGSVLSLSFTADNRFLLSSHKGGKLNIWSIVDNQLYKSFQMESDMVWHSFTPDNQFLVSIFNGRRQANVWNNYIGRLTSTRGEEALSFEPEIRHMEEDYRKELEKGAFVGQLQLNEQVEDVIDAIPDAQDGVPNYSFKDITKWMPLVYYDEIRNRNAPTSSGELPSMPFFLDFKNLTEQKKKIQEEIQKQAREKRRSYSQQKDKHLKNQSHDLTLTQQSTIQDHLQQFNKLCSLSVAEVDYQLRSFLLNPSNKPHLVAMIYSVLKEETPTQSQQLKNIILNRIINLLGGDLLSSELITPCSELLSILDPPLKDLKARVDRCVAIANRHLL